MNLKPPLGYWLGKLRQFGMAHPEWWMLLLSAAAWLVFLRPGSEATCCAWLSREPPEPEIRNAGTALLDWLVMVLAMMLPLMVIPARVTAFRSLWRRRHLAIAIFLGGYLGIWAGAGVLSWEFLGYLRQLHAWEHWTAAAAFLAAAVWQITTLKARCASACHLTRPLHPIGWLADRDCFCFGMEHGFYCVGNCGVLMLAAMLSPLHRTMMVVATLLLGYERYRAKPRDQRIPTILGLLAIAQFL